MPITQLCKCGRFRTVNEFMEWSHWRPNRELTARDKVHVMKVRCSDCDKELSENLQKWKEALSHH